MWSRGIFSCIAVLSGCRRRGGCRGFCGDHIYIYTYIYIVFRKRAGCSGEREDIVGIEWIVKSGG